MSDSDPVLVTRDGRVALVTLNRPSKMNALSAVMCEQIVKLMAELDEDKEVGAIVITGAGDRAFCAGMDLSELSLNVNRRFNPYEAIDRTRMAPMKKLAILMPAVFSNTIATSV